MNLVLQLRPLAYGECAFRGGTAGTCDTHVPQIAKRCIEDKPRPTGWGSMSARYYWSAQL